MKSFLQYLKEQEETAPQYEVMFLAPVSPNKGAPKKDATEQRVKEQTHVSAKVFHFVSESIAPLYRDGGKYNSGGPIKRLAFPTNGMTVKYGDAEGSGTTKVLSKPSTDAFGLGVIPNDALQKLITASSHSSQAVVTALLSGRLSSDKNFNTYILKATSHARTTTTSADIHEAYDNYNMGEDDNKFTQDTSAEAPTDGDSDADSSDAVRRGRKAKGKQGNNAGSGINGGKLVIFKRTGDGITAIKAWNIGVSGYGLERSATKTEHVVNLMNYISIDSAGQLVKKDNVGAKYEAVMLIYGDNTHSPVFVYDSNIMETFMSGRDTSTSLNAKKDNDPEKFRAVSFLAAKQDSRLDENGDAKGIAAFYGRFDRKTKKVSFIKEVARFTVERGKAGQLLSIASEIDVNVALPPEGTAVKRLKIPK